MACDDQSAGERRAGKNTGFGGFLLRAIVLFVVIAGGVATGFLIARHLSRSDGGMFHFEPSDLLNRTELAIGDPLPTISVFDQRDSLLALGPLPRGQKVILAFISEGCEPCEDLLSFLEEREVTPGSGCRVILLSLGSGGCDEKAGFETFRIKRDVLDELNIRIFPTVVGFGTDGKIAFVSSGFSRVMTGYVIKGYL